MMFAPVHILLCFLRYKLKHSGPKTALCCKYMSPPNLEATAVSWQAVFSRELAITEESVLSQCWLAITEPCNDVCPQAS